MIQKLNAAGTILIQEYVSQVEPTDKMPDALEPVLLGLFGEVGSVMATAKKYHREQSAYIGRKKAVIDELGDVLWYLRAICSRLEISFESVFQHALEKSTFSSEIAATDIEDHPISLAYGVDELPELDYVLLDLGEAAATLLRISSDQAEAKKLLSDFVVCYLSTVQAASVKLSSIFNHNLTKTRGRFLEPDFQKLPTFDREYDLEERIPDHFEIYFTQRKSGKSYMQWNGVFIGEPLTDNITDKDGYRFHDVFHLAHAAILHWSPVMRALIKQKRKSNQQVDETQDGGRAIVIEEGLTAWIFSQAKELNFFEKEKIVSFDLLKTIQQFVAGYEVAAVPLSLWERAILQGYIVFRKIKANNGGIVIGDRTQRSLTYKPLPS